MKDHGRAGAVDAAETAAAPRLEWTMIDVNDEAQQGDAHLVCVENGKNVLIDAGVRELAEKALLPLLAERGISALDLVFISHAHADHYGGLDALLDHGIGIEKLYFNLPERWRCEREVPWGCDYRDVQRILRRLGSKGIVPVQARTGQRFQLGERSRLDIIFAYDGRSPRLERADINDMSLVMKLRHDGFSFLFTGDLNEDIGAYLAEHSGILAADVLKIPHHGVEPITPDSFFEKVAPRWGLVSTPAQFWLSEMSTKVKDWFAKRNIPVHVSGISGQVSVVVEHGELRFDPPLA